MHYLGVIAQAAQQNQPTPIQQLIGTLMPLVLIFVIMYLIIIRPQKKKAQQHQALLARLKAGDKVVTSGGIHGTVAGVQEQTITVSVAKNVTLTMARNAISRVVDSDQEEAKQQ